MPLPVRNILSKAIDSKIGAVGKNAATAPIAIYETWARMIGRAIQFVFALVVIGLYARRIDVDSRAGRPQAAAWLYAVTVGILSNLTALLFALPIPFLKTHRLFIWDFVLFALWIACFGTFGAMYLNRAEDAEAYPGTSNGVMKVAVYIDLVNAILWMGTAGYGCCRTFLGKKVDAKINKTKEAALDKMGV
jgi:hypothetical protein